MGDFPIRNHSQPVFPLTNLPRSQPGPEPHLRLRLDAAQRRELLRRLPDGTAAARRLLDG